MALSGTARQQLARTRERRALCGGPHAAESVSPLQRIPSALSAGDARRWLIIGVFYSSPGWRDFGLLWEDFALGGCRNNSVDLATDFIVRSGSRQREVRQLWRHATPRSCTAHLVTACA